MDLELVDTTIIEGAMCETAAIRRYRDVEPAMRLLGHHLIEDAWCFLDTPNTLYIANELLPRLHLVTVLVDEDE